MKTVIKQLEEQLQKETEGMTHDEAKMYLNSRVGMFSMDTATIHLLEDTMKRTELCRRLVAELHKQNPELFDKPIKDIDDLIAELEQIP